MFAWWLAIYFIIWGSSSSWDQFLTLLPLHCRYTWDLIVLITAKDCPAGMEYTECGSPCPRTCSSLYVLLPQECSNECQPKCQCLPGHFLHNGQCIEELECPCIHHRHEYAQGDQVKMGCNKWWVWLRFSLITLITELYHSWNRNIVPNIPESWEALTR